MPIGKHISTLFTSQEHAQIVAAAKKKNKSLSQYTHDELVKASAKVLK